MATGSRSSDVSTPHFNFKDVIAGELGGHTWQFPSDVFVKMLSPRTLNLKDPLSSRTNRSRSDFNFDVEKPFFTEVCDKAVTEWANIYDESLQYYEKGQVQERWPPNMNESECDTSVAKLMTRAFRTCHDALSSVQEASPWSKRYHDGTTFINYNRPTRDRIPGSPGALKPGVVGGGLHSDLEKKGKGSNQKRAYWAPEKIDMVLELKESWPDLIRQAETYARCLFHASPSRSFVPLLGFNHKTTELRFLVFHRSGLTASMSLHPTKDARDFLSLVMAMLLWTSSCHAGLNPTCDENNFFLPTSRDDTQGAEWLYSVTVVRGRATRVHRLVPVESNSSVPQQDPNVISDPFTTHRRRSPRLSNKVRMTADNMGQIFSSLSQEGVRDNPIIRFAPGNTGSRGDDSHRQKGIWEAVYDNGEAQSTAIFLPERGKMETCDWQLFDVCPDSVESRSMWCFGLETVGRSIEHAKSTLHLFRMLAHAHLGWLDVYQAGHLHRDISIGNVLEWPEPENRKPFAILDFFRQKSTLEAQMSNLSFEDIEMGDVLTQCERLEKLLKDDRLSGPCHAFVADRDMSKGWKRIVQNLDNQQIVGERSGTRQFMSTALLNSSDDESIYVQSPIDDLESFFRVAVWAILYNSHMQNMQSKEEQKCRTELNRDANSRDGATNRLIDLGRYGVNQKRLQRMGYCVMTAQAVPVLLTWWEKLVILRSRWNTDVRPQAEDLDEYLSEKALDSDEKRDVMAHYWRTHWHQCAFEGVCIFLESLKTHLSRLKEYKEFD